jgi:hypothetical protein
MAARQERAAGLVEMIFHVQHVRVADFDRHLEEIDRIGVDVEVEFRIVRHHPLDDAAMNVDSVLFFSGQYIQSMLYFVISLEFDDEFVPWARRLLECEVTCHFCSPYIFNVNDNSANPKNYSHGTGAFTMSQLMIF